MRENDVLLQKNYPKIIKEVEKLLAILEGESTDSEIMEHKNQAENKLDTLLKKLQETLLSLERNVEWDVFTIAFYGETNAGKSTLIETLRILLEEKTKLMERGNYVNTLDEYKQTELEVSDLQSNLIELEISNENKIREYKNIIEDIITEKNALENSLEENISNANKLNYEILQEVIYSFDGLLKSIVHRLDEQKELKKIELLIFELKQQVEQHREDILKNKKIIEEVESEYENVNKLSTDKVLILDEKLAQLAVKLERNSDGNIVGDGRSDYTQKVKEYRFNMGSLQFCILDLPGIEGKEELVQKEIDTAVEKAHVVFYVSAKATCPQKGSDDSFGTIEKIGRQLKKQSEVYFVYNKRVKNPRQLSRELISVGESESLDEVDQVMRDTLGEQYMKHLSLSAYPAFVSVGNYWEPGFEKSKKKFIDVFGSSENVLENSKVKIFSKWMVSQLVNNVKDKIVRSNFRKTFLSLNETRRNIEEVSESLSVLVERLEGTFKDTSYQLDETGEIFHRNILNAINKSINNFKSGLREGIYSEIDDNIKMKEFTKKLKVRIEEETKELIKGFQKEVNDISKEFETDLSNIIKKYERYVDELVESYSNSLNLSFEFNPEINIKSGVNKFGVATSIIGNVVSTVTLAISITNPVGWVVLVISVFGGALSVGKKIKAHFDNAYYKSQQRKNADENIEKVASRLQEEIEKEIGNIITSVKEEINSIQNKIEKSVSQVLVMAEAFQEVEEELELMALDVKRKGELIYGND